MAKIISGATNGGWAVVVTYFLLGVAALILLTRQNDLHDIQAHLTRTEQREACLESVVGAMQNGTRPEDAGRPCPNGE